MNIQLWRTVNIAAVLIHILYTAISYTSLPDIIPALPADLSKVEVVWESKNSILFLPFVNVAMFIALLVASILLGKGSLHDKVGINIPDEWREDPTGEIQTLVVVMLEAFNIYSTLIFSFLTLATVYAAKGNDPQLVMMMIVIVCIFPPLLILGTLMAKGEAIQRKNASTQF